MRKRERAILAAVLVVIALLLTFFSVNAVGASSDDAVRLLGDVNESGRIDAPDVTFLQRYMVGCSVSGFYSVTADVNGNGTIDILDAVLMQRYLTGYAADCPIGCDLREAWTPREVRCVSCGAERAELQWDAPMMPSDGYEVYVRTSAEDDTERFLADVREPSCAATGLSPNTDYVFTVFAYRVVDGEIVRAENGTELSLTTMAPPVADLTLTLTVDRVYLTWTASRGADGYAIYCDTGEGPALCADTDRTFCRSSNITGNTKYKFSVRTYKTVNGVKVISSDASSAEDWSSPSMPGFTVTRSNGVFTVKWSKTKGADKYEVMMQTPDEAEMSIVALTDALSCSLPAGGIPEALFAVRSVKYADGKEYRGEYRVKSCSMYAPAGTLGSFGDSIVWGLGAHQFGYSEIIGYTHRLQVDNRGANSATLSVTEGRHCICDDVLSYVNDDSTYDYILVEGGINDYYTDSLLGSVTPDGTTEFDRSTVCGALETMLSHIRSAAPSAKTVFVLVHDINDTGVKKNQQGLTFTDYTAGIKDVCAKYGVEIADCSTQFKTADSEMSRRCTFTRRGIFPDSDGIHPNEEGYRLYVPVIEEKLFGA